MNPAPPPAVEGVNRLVAQMCESGQLSPKACQLLSDGKPHPALLTELEDAGLAEDAVRILAYSLKKPQAIWWGCLCVWSLYRPSPPRQAEAVLHAVLRWLHQPTEANRRVIEEPAWAAGGNTPEGLLGLAAIWSEGSMSPPGQPTVDPPAHLSAKSVANAVILAGAINGPADAPVYYHGFLDLGKHVLSSKNTWQAEQRPQPGQ